jgi:SAM-dependent methyltransferase
MALLAVASRRWWTVAVRGYDSSTYGEAMADVYDDWYGDEADPATVAALVELAGPGPVLELGVGTGRVAIPLTQAGLAVDGIDSSPAMLQRLRAKPGGDRVAATCGDMAGADPPGPYTLVFATSNTFFNLRDHDHQARCVANVAARLLPGGRFVIEAFVPDDRPPAGHQLDVRTITADRVVLSASTTDVLAQVACGQHIEITERGGVRLRPWRIRWATPPQLDDLAGRAGLTLEHRWAGWSSETFAAESTNHVSVYLREEGHNLL